MPMLIIGEGKEQPSEKRPGKPFRGVGGSYSDDSSDEQSTSDRGGDPNLDAAKQLRRGIESGNDRLIAEAISSLVRACLDEEGE